MKHPIRTLPLNALAIAAVAALAAGPAHAQAGAPQGASPLLSAVIWMQDSLMGNVATAVAVMAVGVVGFMMLTGRLNWRYGATVILGCFILFGAATIVGGIQAAAGGA
ncbi:TrbC/VirB2 family protein [Caulobacter sp. SL161]|uniref:TrbC/VirB2 family protein n=1 Tax=Caulobacter sp. SL161 TaxID=2995156 RepID=UPI0022740204|nr:TrbC/VirB2 family protein [Caulobacter sp. SL161]MCY1647473.1 TrbC/VirB2 family protein [Caulobacter sp. SL161]